MLPHIAKYHLMLPHFAKYHLILPHSNICSYCQIISNFLLICIMISSASLAAEDPLDANSRRNRSHFYHFSFEKHVFLFSLSHFENLQTKRAYVPSPSLSFQQTSFRQRIIEHMPFLKIQIICFWNFLKVGFLFQGPWLLWLFLHNSLHPWDPVEDVCVWSSSKGWLHAISRYEIRRRKT